MPRVRVAHLPDSTLAATHVGEVRRVLCASPAYIARRGMPRAPAALREHDCIMERDSAETEVWRFGAASGRPLLPISIRPRLVVNSAAAPGDSAVGGHGITRVMSYQAAAAIAAGKLTVLLAQHEPPPLPVHLVLPSRARERRSKRPFSASQRRCYAAPSSTQRHK
jgi:DNA-binding transcriptional LysR family regulator